jgi:hypothetical protein
MRFISELSFFPFPKGRVLLGFLAVLLTFPACQNPTSTEDAPSPNAGNVVSVSLTFGTTDTFLVGHQLKPGDVTITAHYSSGSQTSISLDQCSSNYDSSTVGEKQVHVTYNGVSSTNETVHFQAPTFLSVSLSAEYSKLNDVTYSDSKFVAVGNSATVLYANSSTLDSWTKVTPITSTGFKIGDNNAHINAIAAGKIGTNNQYVAVGGKSTENYAAIAYSSNGTSFTNFPQNPASFTSTPFEGTNITDVAFGNDTFIAIGGFKTLRSNNGSDWSNLTGVNFPFIYNPISCITYGEGKFLIASESGQTATSSNGITWTASTNTINTNVHAIAYGDGKFVAVGNSGGISYSSNGSWQQDSANSAITANLTCIVHNGDGLFLAGGSNGKIYYLAKGTTSWIAVFSSNNVFEDSDTITAIAYAPPSAGSIFGKFVAVGYGDNNKAKIWKTTYANP